MRTKDKLLKLKDQIDKDVKATNRQIKNGDSILLGSEALLLGYSKELGYIIRKFEQG